MKAILNSYNYKDTLVTILGPNDFEGYAYNKPGQKWDLVQLIGSEKKFWIARKCLTEV